MFVNFVFPPRNDAKACLPHPLVEFIALAPSLAMSIVTMHFDQIYKVVLTWSLGANARYGNSEPDRISLIWEM
jgi:hypothetical protein